MGVARLSWTQTSSGSWNGSVSSLPVDTTLSAVSEEGGGAWDWACGLIREISVNHVILFLIWGLLFFLMIWMG